MRRNGGMGRAALGMIVALGLGAPGAARAAKLQLPLPGRVYTWDFQADTLGQKPGHTVAFGGNWQVIEDSTSVAAQDSVPPPSAPRLLSQLEGDDGIAYHYLTFARPTLGDLDASVRFRIRSGEIDPSAGLLFQMDPKGSNGYLVRASGRSGELTFHYILYGKRRDVKYAKIPPLTPGAWHTLAVVRRKSQLHVSYDGKEVMLVRDDRFSKGNVGVWSEDDTLVDFQGLTATAR
jgi:hypothetical protein